MNTPNPTATPDTDLSPRQFLRDVSLETIDHIRDLDLDLFIKPNAKIPEAESNFQIAVLIWLLHHEVDEDEIEDHVRAGTAREAARKFRRNPAALWALPEVIPAVTKVKEILSRNHFLDAVETMQAPDPDGPGQTAV